MGGGGSGAPPPALSGRGAIGELIAPFGISQISSSYALTDLVALGLRERRVEEAVCRRS